MAATPSKMVDLGTVAPGFALPDVVSGSSIRLADFPVAQPLLIMFLSRHCPYVQHIKAELTRLGRDYTGRIGMVAISSNDVRNHPDDAPSRLREMAMEERFSFPLCYDESQQVARAYGATCTPDFFVFGPARRLVYRGQLDASRPGNGIPVTGADLRAALDDLLAGRAISPEQHPSIGCNIKWK